MSAPPDSGLPSVVVVVLTWNDSEMTTDCVGSVLENDYANKRVILVDNGSSTPCGQLVKAKCPGIELLELPVNQGFCGGSNRGLERALELGADYVHLIGNDAVVERGAISALVRFFESGPDAGAASPLLFEPGGERVVQFYRATIDRDCAQHHHESSLLPYDPERFQTVATEFVPFVAVMFRRAALEQVGTFDECFCTCWEDYDMCLRLTDAGWRIFTVGDSEVVHLGSQTTGRKSPYLMYYTGRNRIICLFRHGRPTRLLRRAPRILRSFLWETQNYGLLNWACHRAYFRGLFDFALGVRGVGHPPRSRKSKA